MAHLQNLRARNQDGVTFGRAVLVDLTRMSKYVQRMSKVCFWPNDSESKPYPCRARRWSSFGYFGNTWNSGTFAENCLLLRRFQLGHVEGVNTWWSLSCLLCFIALFWVKMRQLRITKFVEYKAIASKFPLEFWCGMDPIDSRHLETLGQMSEMRLSVRKREGERERETVCVFVLENSHESECIWCVFSPILKSFGEAQKEHDTVHSSKMLSVVSSTKPWSWGAIPPISFSPWHHFATTV